MTNIETALQKTVGFGCEEFAEKAVQGGWDYKKVFSKKPEEYRWVNWFFEGEQFHVQVELAGGGGVPMGHWYLDIARILLDPTVWEAVAKVEGWGTEMVMIDEAGHPKEWCYYNHCDRCGAVISDEEEGCPEGCESDNAPIPSWLYEMHRFLDALIEQV